MQVRERYVLILFPLVRLPLRLLSEAYLLVLWFSFVYFFCRVLLQNSVALSRGRKVLFRLWLSLRTLGLKVARKIVNCVGSTQNI